VFEKDGSVFAAGTTSGLNGGDHLLIKLDENGLYDSSFANSGKLVVDIQGSDNLRAMSLCGDNSFVVGGYSKVDRANDVTITHYDFNGNFVSSNEHYVFNVGSQADVLNSLYCEGDFLYFAGSTYTSRNGGANKYVGRFDLRAEGLDSSFGDEGIAEIFSEGLDNQGGLAVIEDLAGVKKIYLSGVYQNRRGNSFQVIQLNSRGQIEIGFGENGFARHEFSDNVYINEAPGLAIQSDGKIVLGGEIRIYDDSNNMNFASGLMRLWP
jgi:hypothetical protein